MQAGVVKISGRSIGYTKLNSHWEVITVPPLMVAVVLVTETPRMSLAVARPNKCANGLDRTGITGPCFPVQQARRDDDLIENRPSMMEIDRPEVNRVFVGEEIKQLRLSMRSSPGFGIAAGMEMGSYALRIGRIVEVSCD